MRITRYAAAFAALGILLAGCSSQAGNQAQQQSGSTVDVEKNVDFPAGTTMARLADAGTITVGTKYDQPGFGLLNPRTNAPEGFDVEVAKIVAGKLGIAPEKIQWKETVSANRVVFMDGGRIVESAEPETFFTRPQSERARDFLSKILEH